MRALFAVVALAVSLVAGSTVLAQDPAEEGDVVDAVLASMTARDKVAQLFVVGFQGPVVGEAVASFIATHKVGGVYITRDACNIVNGHDLDPVLCGFEDDAVQGIDQLRALTQDLQEASCSATRGTLDGQPYCLPMLISVDHEGDDRPLTRLLDGFTSIPSNMAIGATFDPQQAENVGCIVGRELAAAGVNMLFGPTLDVLDSPRSGGAGDQGVRTFGGDPRWVAEMGAAYVQGLHECGGGRVAATVKHFPGHGRSTRSVDYDDVPVIVKTLEQLKQADLAPFRAVAGGEPGVGRIPDAIMNSHLSYPDVSGCDSEAPITFSATCMATFMSISEFTIWRDEGGVAVADDLASGAVNFYANRRFGRYLQDNVVEEALLAGNDLLPLIRQWQWQELGQTIDFLVLGYENDPLVRERIDDAARRIVTLKLRLSGSLDPAAVTAAPEEDQATNGPAMVSAMVAKSVTFIKPESLDVYRQSMFAPSVSQQILFVECWDDPRCAIPNENDYADYPPLWPKGTLEDMALELFPGRVSGASMRTISFTELEAALDDGGAFRETVDAADWIVFAFLERDPTNFPASEVLKDFLGRGAAVFDLRDKQIVVLAYNSPYHLDAGELRNVDLFLALYSKIDATLRSSLKVLFQDPAMIRDVGGGRLPVDYVFGDFVLYDIEDEVAPDPTQTIQVSVEPESVKVGEEARVSLNTALIANNGHRVSDGTIVTFRFELPDETFDERLALTEDGLASVTYAGSVAGDVSIIVASGELEALVDGSLEVTAEPALPVEPESGVDSNSGGVPVLLIASSGAAAAILGGAAIGFAAWQRRRRPAEADVAPAEADETEGERRAGEQGGAVAADMTRISSPPEARTFASGRYVVVKLLGRGAQKSVYLVDDTVLGRECALSMLNAALLDPSDVDRLRREAQTMAQFGTQPNIVTVHDYGEEDGAPFIVCEYVPGGELRDELAATAGPLPLDRALTVAIDICRALSFAHGRDIVHRDLKPENVWLTEERSAKLGDFGIALTIGRTRLTMPGGVTGTATYMAPEQVSGGDVDARSDLYAFGALLYELVTGRPPFVGDDPNAIMYQHVNVNPESPVEHNESLPPRLERLILRLLAKPKTERPGSAEEVLAELENAAAELTGGPAAAAVGGAGRRVAVGDRRQETGDSSPIEQEIRFCTSADGTRIAYATYGEPSVRTLVFVMGFEGAQSANYPGPVQEGLASDRMLVTFDRRGVGGSQRDVDDLAIPAQVADLAAVVDQLGLESIDLMGVGNSGGLVSAYAAEHPERVGLLVLWQPHVRVSDSPLQGFQEMAQSIRTNWSFARRSMATFLYPNGPTELQRWYSSMLRDSLAPEMAARHFEVIAEFDGRTILPSVKAPTLVLAHSARHDLEIASAIASLIPDARLVTLEGDFGALFVEPSQVLAVVRNFLDDERTQ